MASALLRWWGPDMGNFTDGAVGESPFAAHGGFRGGPDWDLGGILNLLLFSELRPS
jgi:hypothetical protein